MRISDWSSDVCSSDLPHPRGAAQAEGRRLQAVARAVPVEGEAQRPGARLHPRELPFEPLDALAGIAKHRLDQVEAFARCTHNFPLGQTFAPFFSRLAVGHDSITPPHTRKSIGTGKES